ncbi:MAG TPA: acetate--CoA ligase family protein [Candidatus Latescibacteria bacterium]|nr:acetate--CoA ligase family protein [Candidatus Latescibacterota bacterium]
MSTDWKKVNRTLVAAERDGRNFLLEPEFYDVLKEAGIPAPRHVFVPAGRAVGRKDLTGLGAGAVVLKVVSPLIIHKSDVGGVAFVEPDAASVNKACASMLRTVPLRYLEWEKRGRGAAGELSSLKAVRESIRGFLVAERIAFDNVGFGSEILLGLRNSRDFGPVLTMGNGGLDVEYMNERLREGRAVAIASAHLLAAGKARGLLEPLTFYGKLASEFRGRKALVSPKVLTETLLRFRDLAAAFSAFSTDSPYVLEEAEVNPFVVRRGRLVALDGVCRFSRDKANVSARPVAAIGPLLRPASIGIIGVSEKMNIGHIILNNTLRNGFPAENVIVVKPGLASIEGCLCVPSVEAMPRTVDLFVLTLAADRCYDVMKDLVEHGKARSVILIAGGMGEKTGGESIEESIQELLREGRRRAKTTPVVNGGNCLGIVSKPGRYDTTFIPEHKLPRPKSPRSDMAVISQSGAFMICRMNKLPEVEPLYAVSLGNQLDLTASDYLTFLKDDPDVKLFAVYMEGFKPGDGLAFARAVGELTASGRAVLVYKAGRSPEGRAATSSHTASVAGDYGVFRAVLEQAGAIVAGDIFEFESFMKGLSFLEGRKVRGRRVGLISNAGFECVVLADNIENGARLDLVPFTPETQKRIGRILQPLGIDRLQDVHNPLDVTPVADDAVFVECARAILEDPDIDCAVVSNVPMTPAQNTLPQGEGHGEDLTRPGSFAMRLIELYRSTDKPVVVNIDAGELYTPLAGYLEAAGVPVFRRADEAVRFLRTYVWHMSRVTDK